MTYYANISDATCPNELYQDITAPDIDYEGKVKITYECNTEFGDPCQVLSMLQRTSSLAKPTSRLARSLFSISQFCNTTAPSSIGIFSTTGGITNVNLGTSAAALETGVITGAASTFSAIRSAENTVSTISSLSISNPGASPKTTSSLIAASDGPTGTIAESAGTTAGFTITQDPMTETPSRVTTGVIGPNGACTCFP